MFSAVSILFALAALGLVALNWRCGPAARFAALLVAAEVFLCWASCLVPFSVAGLNPITLAPNHFDHPRIWVRSGIDLALTVGMTVLLARYRRRWLLELVFAAFALVTIHFYMSFLPLIPAAENGRYELFQNAITALAMASCAGGPRGWSLLSTADALVGVLGGDWLLAFRPAPRRE